MLPNAHSPRSPLAIPAVQSHNARMSFVFEPSGSLADQLAALDQGCAVRVSNDRVIAVRGKDRVEWVSGMVTNEVKSVTPGATRYAAIVHEKGKLLADVWILARVDDVLLVAPTETIAALLEHFDKHIIMEDVEVAATEDRVVLAAGARSQSVFVPDGARSFATARLARPGVDLIADEALMSTIRARVEAGDAVAVSDEAWAIVRLEAGMPQWGVDFGAENYVQEADITRRAVSFNKGCYVGQEVVCRLEMRGHVRRQLVTLRIPGEPVPAGTAVGETGSVTSSAPSRTPGESVAFAMVKWDVATSALELDVAGRVARVVRVGA